VQYAGASGFTCANALLARFGGPRALTAFCAGLPKEWRVGDKTGNNGKHAFGDIAVIWPTREEQILICAYTRGGSPTSSQVDDVFAKIGRYVGMHLSAAA
jgi:beta-lactamase class A